MQGRPKQPTQHSHPSDENRENENVETHKILELNQVGAWAFVRSVVLARGWFSALGGLPKMLTHWWVRSCS